MRRALLLLPLLTACADGLLRDADGVEQLRTAVYLPSETEDPQVREALVVLSNSPLPCELPETDDPAEQDEALARLAAGVTREGARLIILSLYQFLPSGADQDWAGDYAIREAVDSSMATATEGVASALYWFVREAAVSDRDGLAISYSYGNSDLDRVFVPEVPEPGEIVLRPGADRLRGSFRFESIDVSGHFDAEACEEGADLFVLLGLASAQVSDVD